MEKTFLPYIGERSLHKFLTLILTAWLSTAVSFAQSPQWVFSQGNNMGAASFNYFRPNDEVSDPYDVNQTNLPFNYFGGTTVTPGHIYGSYFYRDDNGAAVGGTFANKKERPLFIICKSPYDNSIVAYSTIQTSANGLRDYTTLIGTLLSATEVAANGANVPQFNIIPRIGNPKEYLAITYMKTGTGTGRLMYWVIMVDGNDGFNVNSVSGPYFARDNNVDITNMGSETGSIAVAKTHTSTDHYLYLALENQGIYQLKISSQGVQNTNQNIIRPNGVNGQTTFANSLICNSSSSGGAHSSGATFGGASGSTFRTSELEVSPDGKFVAWGDQNTSTNDATVYTLATDATKAVVKYKVGSTVFPYRLTQQRINGIEFNPNFNPVGGACNIQLYATAGTDNGSLSDGLFALDITAPNTPTPKLGTYNSRCAQSQLEVDYNRTLNMVQRLTPTQNNQLQRYIMDAPGVTGQWFSRVAYRAESPATINPYAPGYDIDVLPRQVDGWDYRFGGAIYGPDMVLVANGCLTGQTTTSETYRAPVIDASKVNVSYYWEVYDPANPSNPILGYNSSITVNFDPLNPNKTYWIYLRTTITEAGFNFTTYSYEQHSLMGVLAHNGCFGSGSRLAQQLESGNQTLIYPNPVVNKQLSIKLPEGYEQAAVEIIDLQGRTVQKNQINKNEETLNIPNLSKGIYILNISTLEVTKREKIVIAY